jgi:outer membrane protein OmpA-like peptidoglycan-associated protein
MAARLRSLAVFPALVASGGLLCGCLTPQAKPVPSKAVAEALAHKDVQAVAASACPDLTSPQHVGFGFGDASLKDVAMEPLEATAASLTCHPALQAVVVGAADEHGTETEQKKLAQDRAQAVTDYLRSKGVAAGRMQTEVRLEGEPPTGDAQHLIVLAEGRRW